MANLVEPEVGRSRVGPGFGGTRDGKCSKAAQQHQMMRISKFSKKIILKYHNKLHPPNCSRRLPDSLGFSLLRGSFPSFGNSLFLLSFTLIVCLFQPPFSSRTALFVFVALLFLRKLHCPFQKSQQPLYRARVFQPTSSTMKAPKLSVLVKLHTFDHIPI